MSDELKPCPFCTAEAELVGGRIYAKHSNFCILYSQIVYDFKQTTWNSRPIEDALRSKLAIAVEALEGIMDRRSNGKDNEPRDYYHLAEDCLDKIRS